MWRSAGSTAIRAKAESVSCGRCARRSSGASSSNRESNNIRRPWVSAWGGSRRSFSLGNLKSPSRRRSSKRNLGEEDVTAEEFKAGLLDLSILADTKFDVPWGGKVLATGFLAWAFLFLGIGVFVAPSLAGLLHLDFADAGSPDDKAYFLLLDQTCELVVGLGLIWLVTRPYSPLPKDLFRFSLEKPFDRRDGWLLWALIGMLGGFLGVGATAYILSLFHVNAGSDSAGTADAVVTMLSQDPKVFLSILTVTSVMAPLLEEVIFRGFLLATLTKWLPAPTAAFVSAGLFGAAHLTSRDFAQLTALGVVLGLTYVRTKNLATPMLIHATWNSGVLFLLEILYLGGYDVTELLKN